MTIQNFRDLRVWQSGMELVEAIYRATQGFPQQELYGLVSQMRRSAVSYQIRVKASVLSS
jgi:four helix bundle protein